MQFSCVFDHAANCFRFDRETDGVVVITQVQPHPMEFNEPLRAIYIRRPEHSLHWSTREHYHEVMRRKANADPLEVVAAFDVRCMGLACNSTLDLGVSFEKTYSGCLANEIVEVAETENLCRVVMRYREDTHSFITFWFDREQGHSPIRIEVCIGSASSTPVQRAEATWQEISDVWVPKTYMGEDFDYPGTEVEGRLELAFEWESVNEPVAEEVFTAAAMGLPPDAPIMSDELEKTIQIGTVGGIEFGQDLSE